MILWIRDIPLNCRLKSEEWKNYIKTFFDNHFNDNHFYIGFDSRDYYYEYSGFVEEMFKIKGYVSKLEENRGSYTLSKFYKVWKEDKTTQLPDYLL